MVTETLVTLDTTHHVLALTNLSMCLYRWCTLRLHFHTLCCACCSYEGSLFPVHSMASSSIWPLSGNVSERPRYVVVGNTLSPHPSLSRIPQLPFVLTPLHWSIWYLGELTANFSVALSVSLICLFFYTLCPYSNCITSKYYLIHHDIYLIILSFHDISTSLFWHICYRHIFTLSRCSLFSRTSETSLGTPFFGIHVLVLIHPVSTFALLCTESGSTLSNVAKRIDQDYFQNH